MSSREQDAGSHIASLGLADELDLQGLEDAVPMDPALIVEAYKDDDFWMQPWADGVETTASVSTVPDAASLVQQDASISGCRTDTDCPPSQTAFGTAQTSPTRTVKRGQHSFDSFHHMLEREQNSIDSYHMQEPAQSQTPASGTGSHLSEASAPNPSVAHAPESPSVTASPTTKRVRSSVASNPAKPLTAYNFFYRFERERLLGYCNDHNCNLDAVPVDDLPEEYNAHLQLTVENSAEFQSKLLHGQWNRDRSVKRKHCKSHGRIPFQSLTKRIAKSWNKLPESVKQVFRNMAVLDKERYRIQKKN
jgi:HMG (high mobility group) box